MCFKGLKADISGSSCGISYSYTLFIRPACGELEMTVRPEFRRNGTQTLDGLLPRFYKTIPAAKGAATKLLGEGLNWVYL